MDHHDHRPPSPLPLILSTGSLETRKPNTPSAPWPSLSDQALASDLANAKLKRQNERISQTESALDAVVRPKGHARGRGKLWKTFDFTDSGDENATSAEETARPLPFDVHAKVFQPRPSSRASAAMDTPFVSPTPSQDSMPPIDDFQLISRKGKPTGLNAYETRSEEKPATVTAPYDKRELNEVFGNDLPGPEYCASNAGFRNGQMQFCMHPNGDVSAQQWSTTQYQWLNLGQFSNIRKRTEGLLAGERLKGETELQSLQQNTLAYFRAVAKQREAAVMGLPFGSKDVQACLSNLRVDRVHSGSTLLPDEHTTASRADRSDNTSQLSATTGHGRDAKNSARPLARPHTIATPGPRHMGPPPNGFTSAPQAASGDSQIRHRDPEPRRDALADLTFGSLPSLSRQLSETPYGAIPTSNIPPQSKLEIPAVIANVGIEVPLAGAQDDAPCPTPNSGHGYQDWVRRKIISKNGNHQSFSTAEIMHPEHSYSAFLEEVIASRHRKNIISGTSAKGQQSPLQYPRVPMKEFLSRIGDSASARGSAASSAARTVLHDPLQDRSLNSESGTPCRTSSGLVESASASCFSTPQRSVYEMYSKSPYTPVVPPGLSQRTELRNFSEPDNDRKKPVYILDVPTPCKAEERILFKSGTPQNFNGPFFADEPGSRGHIVDHRDYEERLHDWFHNGSKVERHEELYRRICAANRTVRVTPTRISNHAVIERPYTAASTSKSAEGEEQSFNETTTRLLIPVIENLYSYTQGRPSQRHSTFTPFTRPPEWCIDRSATGSRSFFDEEWGKPPARIGRDQRYRAMPFGSRFGSFESDGLGAGLASLGPIGREAGR